MTPPERIGRYEILRRIGKSMTDVYLARDVLEKRQVALKLVPTGGDAETRMIVAAERRGAEIQKELAAVDPRVVEIYEYGEQAGWFFVAMQYVEGRSLAEVLRSERVVHPDRAAIIAIELCEQLAAFHSARSAVVHGDVKPSNIHLGPHDTVRLLDFGIARTLRQDCESTAHEFGSPGYCSPERLARSEVDAHSDLWAVGATLYEMLAGAPPFQEENTRKLEARIRSRRPPRPLPTAVPVGLRMVVAKTLAPDPKRRYRTAGHLRADLLAFLERRTTVAETERRAGATIEAARVAIRKATQTVARARRRLQVAGALGWFTAGMALWMGGAWTWQALQAHPALAPPAAPGALPNVSLLYRAEGERVLGMQPVDWRLAEVLLQRAVELGNTDAKTLSNLALAHNHGVVPAPAPTVTAPALVKAKAKMKAPRKKTTARSRRRRWR